jgi:hypothetical protein
VLVRVLNVKQRDEEEKVSCNRSTVADLYSPIVSCGMLLVMLLLHLTYLNWCCDFDSCCLQDKMHGMVK